MDVSLWGCPRLRGLRSVSHIHRACLDDFVHLWRDDGLRTTRGFRAETTRSSFAPRTLNLSGVVMRSMIALKCITIVTMRVTNRQVVDVRV